ncbi:PREDICTED: uncharacterized protein LOC106744464 [Dinoponera quadriceps]|uniref:Uncharacterized protein LOC106744464 n=1 Tax=Dinoponera quadriceps TaxID=609295 RepID=A0A6P3X947_DINQU|nr:PREDICTED: uncharacterized protein LOC106744464 [Dinoponera quadriceps]
MTRDLKALIPDSEWAIKLHRITLKIIGLWPPDNRKAHEMVRSKLRLLCNVTTIFFVTTIPTLISLIQVWGDMILMIENLQLSLPLVMTVFKIYVIWYKQEALAPLIDMIEKDWIKVKMKEERDVMLKCAMITRVIAMCGMFILICAVSVTLILPCFGLMIRQETNLTDHERPLPLQSYYLHDVSKSPHFELTFVAQGIIVFTGGLTYSVVDHFLGLLVIHMCGQLQNLNLRLTHMENYPNFDAALKYNVQDHTRLIRCSTYRGDRNKFE